MKNPLHNSETPTPCPVRLLQSCLACQLFSCFIKFNYISIPSLWYHLTALEAVYPLFARISLIDVAGNRSFSAESDFAHCPASLLRPAREWTQVMVKCANYVGGGGHYGRIFSRRYA